MTEKLADLLKNKGVYSKTSSCTFERFLHVCYRDNAPKSLDLSCPKCKVDKTFIFVRSEELNSLGTLEYSNGKTNITAGRIKVLIYECPSCGERLLFLLYFDGTCIVKIAQYPSLYDVSRDELKKYQKNGLLEDDSFSQLYKAELCASSSYYIAAYTYMRRVYETMLLSVFDQNKDEIGLTEDDFRKLHSDKKLEAIKDYLAIDDEIYLPLYGLLSAGIHAMTEEQCCEDYNVLKPILLDILAEQKAKKEKESKRKELKALFAKRKGEIK